MARKRNPEPRPHGREQTIDAIIDAASRLYRERSPADVTMQEIADSARVNRGLVHRHFGSKEDLLAAVFRAASKQGADVVSHAGNLKDALADLRKTSAGYANMLAWALLSGADPQQFVGRSPAVDALLKLAHEESSKAPPSQPGADPPFDPRFVVGAALVLSLGWQIFEPFVVAAAGMDDMSPAKRRNELARLIDLIIDHALPHQGLPAKA